jgi:hypothetical protein
VQVNLGAAGTKAAAEHHVPDAAEQRLLDVLQTQLGLAFLWPSALLDHSLAESC